MQPIRQLTRALATLAGAEHYLFSLADLRALFPGLSDTAFKTLLSRAVSEGYLARVCRGLYLYELVDYPRGQLLFHAAARLRADTFNYISLETALSDAGAISDELDHSHVSRSQQYHTLRDLGYHRVRAYPQASG